MQVTSKNTALERNSSSNLPDGWQMVRFDQMAECIVNRVDPAETDLDIYVGLEHLDLNP